MYEEQRIYGDKFKQQQELNVKLLDKVEALEREIKLNNNVAMAGTTY